jgi:ectoine hydroxylase-related dioxygenase (phytanoyl-CoA dioxygenase family)
MHSPTSQSLTSRLNSEQVTAYQRDGYVLCHEPVFDPSQFARLRAIFEENLDRYGEANLDTMHFRDPRLLEFLLADEVLDLVEPVVGPDIGLWSSHFISKPPHVGKATPWHEDSSYWNGRISTMAGICTVWLAIDAATAENGCMKVIPGSHHNGFSEYEPVDIERNIFGSQIKPELIDESRAVYFELQPNECSLHEARLIHGADANTSDHRRAGYTMRYFPTSSQVYPERNPGHKLWLARGRDRGENRFENA